jgi:hypothetical protein
MGSWCVGEIFFLRSGTATFALAQGKGLLVKKGAPGNRGALCLGDLPITKQVSLSGQDSGLPLVA